MKTAWKTAKCEGTYSSFEPVDWSETNSLSMERVMATSWGEAGGKKTVRPGSRRVCVWGKTPGEASLAACCFYACGGRPISRSALHVAGWACWENPFSPRSRLAKARDASAATVDPSIAIPQNKRSMGTDADQATCSATARSGFAALTPGHMAAPRSSSSTLPTARATSERFVSQQ